MLHKLNIHTDLKVRIINISDDDDDDDDDDYFMLPNRRQPLIQERSHLCGLGCNDLLATQSVPHPAEIRCKMEHCISDT